MFTVEPSALIGEPQKVPSSVITQNPEPLCVPPAQERFGLRAFQSTPPRGPVD